MKIFEVIKSYARKIKDTPKDIQPLNFLMIRTTRQAKKYAKKNIKYKIINTKNIILLHPLDRKHAIKKFLKRKTFIKKKKKEIQKQIKIKGYYDLEILNTNTPFTSTSKILVYNIKKNKYITGSGVGRISAIQSAFPNGIKIKIQVGTISYPIKKKLIDINTSYIHANKFKHTKKYGIYPKETVFTRKKKKKIHKNKTRKNKLQKHTQNTRKKNNY